MKWSMLNKQYFLLAFLFFPMSSAFSKDNLVEELDEEHAQYPGCVYQNGLQTVFATSINQEQRIGFLRIGSEVIRLKMTKPKKSSVYSGDQEQTQKFEGTNISVVLTLKEDESGNDGNVENAMVDFIGTMEVKKGQRRELLEIFGSCGG